MSQMNLCPRSAIHQNHKTYFCYTKYFVRWNDVIQTADFFLREREFCPRSAILSAKCDFGGMHVARLSHNFQNNNLSFGILHERVHDHSFAIILSQRRSCYTSCIISYPFVVKSCQNENKQQQSNSNDHKVPNYLHETTTSIQAPRKRELWHT